MLEHLSSRITVVGGTPVTEDFGPPVPMSEPFAEGYERGYGYRPIELVQAWQDTRLVVLGVGGSGQGPSVLAAKNGCLDIVVADPEAVDRTNIRQPHFRNSDVGENKALVAANAVIEANDSTKVRAYTQGVTTENLEDMLFSGLKKGRKIVIYDGIDMSRPDLSLHTARVARQHGIPVTWCLDIGEGGAVWTFNPYAKRTYEKIMGIKQDTQPEDLLLSESSISRVAAFLPKTGALSTLISMGKDIPGMDNEGNLVIMPDEMTKKISLPTQPNSIAIASGIAANELDRVVMYSHGKRYMPPTFAPHMRWLDANDGGGATRHPRLSHYKRLAYAVIRDQLHLNPRPAYTPEDVASRDWQRRQYIRKLGSM